MTSLSNRPALALLQGGVILGLLLCTPAVDLHASPGPAQADGPIAPDGRPGFGTARGAQELGQLFRSPTEEQEDFLRGLHDLSSDIVMLREMARRTYVQRGYFEALETGQTVDLEPLHRRFQEQAARAGPILAGGGKSGESLAVMLLDLRFRLRIPLLAAFDEEGPQLRRGLAVMNGSQDGLFDLKDAEARSIARRMDLSAARLRAVRSDLDALRERGAAGAPGSADPAWATELGALQGSAPGDDRARALRSVQNKLKQRMQRLESVLFSPRLEPRLRSDMDKRRTMKDQAEVHLGRCLRYQLVPPFDQDPSPVILEMSRSDRFRYALSEGLRGLDLDPLNEDLTYWTARAADEVEDPRISRPWFDRYLALRGIRSDKQDTMRGRSLSPQEKHALEEVLQAFVAPGPARR